MYPNCATFCKKYMSKTAMIRARINPGLKKDVEAIFRKLGMTSSDAINIYYSQVKLYRGIPFDVKIPNKETRLTFENTDKRKKIKGFSSAAELLKDLKK
jgi:DNA-damage-inducible protein J